ncbi:MAG: 50S ribosomal protein L11 methyltransferase [Limnohabitans sp.]|nr:50S ribosomal protein L11 methyltransferase [Limnohabitans sp.]
MFEICILSPQDQVKIISDALMVLDACSVSVEDADAHTDAEQALFGEPDMPPPQVGWIHSRVIALFNEQEDAEQASQWLSQQDFMTQCKILQISQVPEQDWVRLTQSQFVPVSITEDFWIVPTWHEPPAQAKTIIRLDPGLAFGTGTHPTTRMCLRWIAKHIQSSQRVLDYGCGSGILAIGAYMHGAKHVDAVDIDPEALVATQNNALPNHCVIRSGLPDQCLGPYQVVLANILASPLKVLAPLLCAQVQRAGHLVLAGILSRQAEELQQAYQPYLNLQVYDEQEGWILMTAKKS